MNRPHLFTNKDEIVQDLLATMKAETKAKIKHTPKDLLVMFHSGLGQYIRNRYRLWQNKAVVKSTGKEEADDASMVIIRELWEQLQAEPGLEKPVETEADKKLREVTKRALERYKKVFGKKPYED